MKDEEEKKKRDGERVKERERWALCCDKIKIQCDLISVWHLSRKLSKAGWH